MGKGIFMTTANRQATPGFSLIEIMVAFLILGLVMAIAVPSYFGIVNSARARSTNASLQVVKNEVNLYQMEHGKFPARLVDLVERPKGEEGKGWRARMDKLPKDAWNNEFYYKVLPSGSKHPYELYSYGVSNPEDSTPEDRISAWE